MLIRIVRMHFKEDRVEHFLKIFQENYKAISGFSGCISVELLRDAADPLCYCTVSRWDADNSLQAYRTSPLFESVWKTVKPMFGRKAEAFSLIDAL